MISIHSEYAFLGQLDPESLGVCTRLFCTGFSFRHVHFFARFWKGGLDAGPVGIQGGLGNFQITEVHGLPANGEARRHTVLFKQVVAAPSGVVVHLSKHGIAHHFHADGVPGPGLNWSGEPSKYYGLIGTVVVVVVFLDRDGLGRDHDPRHVIFHRVDGETGALCSLEFHFVFDHEVGQFVWQSGDGSVLVFWFFSAAQHSVDGFPLSLCALPWITKVGVEFAFVDDLPGNRQQRFFSRR